MAKMHDGDSHDPDKSTGADRALGDRLKAARTPSAEDEAYDIRIARDGTWYYQGTPIGRPALVKLFATVLRRDEAGDFWLITPAERGRITVEDAPFVAVAMTVENAAAGREQTLAFRTNLDHMVEAGPEHPIAVAFDPESGEPRPYIRIKDRLDALIGRAVYYDLVERAEEHEGRVGVWSKGRFFPLDQDR
jgi:hypothetical protein